MFLASDSSLNGANKIIYRNTSRFVKNIIMKMKSYLPMTV